MADIRNIEVSGNSYPIKAPSVVDRRGQAEGSLKFWSGTREEYEALAESEALDDTMLYNISNDPNSPMAYVNVNELISSLNNKADRDLGNTSPSMSFAEAMSQNGISTVVESHVEEDGSAWYRIWSDGWCEQGGLLKNVAHASTTTIPFLKEYSRVINANVSGKGDSTGAALVIRSLTPINITIYYQGIWVGYTLDIYWQVSGFIRQ